MLVEEHDLTARLLADLVDGLIADPARLEALSTAAFAEGERHRSDTLIELIDEIAGGVGAGAR